MTQYIIYVKYIIRLIYCCADFESVMSRKTIHTLRQDKKNFGTGISCLPDSSFSLEPVFKIINNRIDNRHNYQGKKR